MLRPAARSRGSRATVEPAGGAPSVLQTPEARLLFILVYQKTWPRQVVQGELFGFSQAQANYWIPRLLPVLQAALDDLGYTPARHGSRLARQERRQTERREWIIDGTERRRQRPKNAEKQASH